LRRWKPVTLQFEAKPLADLAKQLAQMSGVNVVLDRVALEEEGVTPDMPVTADLKDIRLEAGLRVILDQFNLTYLVAHDVLLITSQVRAGNALITRTYPVRDLCGEPEDFAELQQAIEQTIAPNTCSEVGGAGTVVPVKASKSLVINQTREVHGQILQLLRSLRDARGKPGAEESKRDSAGEAGQAR
jgi:hypothetical protein